MKKILVSECLYGGKIVRYDGGDTTERMPDLGNGKKKAVLFPCVRRYSADWIHQDPILSVSAQQR